jgi:hypothetical protein
MSKPIRLAAAGAAACAAAIAPAIIAVPALADGAAPIYVTFDKHAVGPGQFEGTTGGAAPGTVHTICTPAPNNPVLARITCDWRISSGERSFYAPLTGTLNGRTGNVVMNGQVASGWQQGAQVHETGHLVNAATGEFAGTIRIQP